ncbi:hypothetical protein VTO42DRAFT_8786 [Malbranchea cinnamomea]
MHLSSWLLAVTCLSAVVSAFYPYGLTEELELIAAKATAKIEPRFYIWLPGVGEETEKEFVPTLDIKKGPKVRRENNYDVVMGSDPTMPDSMAINNDGLDYSYFSVVTFGSKSQEMWLLLDTGAANTWVMSTNCTTKACLAHNTFGPEDSTTLTVTENEWSVTYGTGHVEGVIVKDSMSFADFNLTLEFGSATKVSDDFLHYPMDGILGLGFTNSQKGVPTVMQVMMNNKLLDKNILGISLQRNSDGARDGQITLGAIDETKFTGDITYTDIVPGANRWEIPIDDALIGGKPAQFEGKTAIIDTGTSFMLLPREDAKTIHSMIPDSVQDGENFKIPCSSTTSVEISISGTRFRVSHKDYVGNSDETGKMCSSRIAGHQPFGKDQWLLGDVFLKNVYSVFDFDENRIGFAPRKYSGSPSPTSVESTAAPDPTVSATLSPMFPSTPAPDDVHDPNNNSKDPDEPNQSGEPNDNDNEQKGAAAGLIVPSSLIILSVFAACSSYVMLAL